MGWNHPAKWVPRTTLRCEKLAFFRCFAEEHLGTLLAGLERAERAVLMNALLPSLVREFPLADLDILGALAPAGDPWAEGDEEA